MGGYYYNGFGVKENMHMLMIILHIFGSNILLLNYLIAILSQSYSDMLESGRFLYQVYLYQYCERYMVGLANKKFGQLVIHPAPICIMNFPIMLLSLIPWPQDYQVLEKVNHAFALMMFWLENIVHVALFLLYELALVPLVFGKNLFIVVWAT